MRVLWSILSAPMASCPYNITLIACFTSHLLQCVRLSMQLVLAGFLSHALSHSSPSLPRTPHTKILLQRRASTRYWLQREREQGTFTAPTPRDRGTTGPTPSRKQHLCNSQTCGNLPPARSIGQEMRRTMGTRPAATAATGMVPWEAERETRPSKFRFAGGEG